MRVSPRRWPRARTQLDDRGSGPIELAFLAMAYFLVIGLAIVAGRLNLGNSEVEGAARTAARTISMSRENHRDAAVAQAEEDAAEAVGSGTSRCDDFGFNALFEIVDGRERVVVTVECDVPIQQFLFIPTGSVAVDGQVTEYMDRYRSES